MGKHLPEFRTIDGAESLIGCNFMSGVTTAYRTGSHDDARWLAEVISRTTNALLKGEFIRTGIADNGQHYIATGPLEGFRSEDVPDVEPYPAAKVKPLKFVRRKRK